MKDTEAMNSLSPSLNSDSSGSVAYEVKFLTNEVTAAALERWAAEALQPDPFGNPLAGYSYDVTSLYTDTQDFSVYHRASGYRRNKYRLRRYGEEQIIHLERKSRKGDRVSKRRVSIPVDEVSSLIHPLDLADWPARWFHQELIEHQLHPVCVLQYQRTAFFGANDLGPLRLTLDRRIRGGLTSDWKVDAGTAMAELLPDQVVLELKFRDVMPGLFKQLIADLQLNASGCSKYRRCLEVLKFNVTEHAPEVKYA